MRLPAGSERSKLTRSDPTDTANKSTAVYGDIPHAFLSDMTHKQHMNLNGVLNRLVETPPDIHDRVHYKRIKQKDSFYRQGGQKIRVSSLITKDEQDERNGQITEIIQKEKVDHLDIYCPAAELDLRISVNTETPRTCLLYTFE
jgi:hypothetical protein